MQNIHSTACPLEKKGTTYKLRITLFSEDLHPGYNLSDSSEGLFKRGGEPGYIGIFAEKKKTYSGTLKDYC